MVASLPRLATVMGIIGPTTENVNSESACTSDISAKTKLDRSAGRRAPSDEKPAVRKRLNPRRDSAPTGLAQPGSS